MFQIQNLTDDTKQKQTVLLEDGTSFTFTLYFRPLQYGWFIDELTYQDFVLYGLRVCNTPNLLHQYRNQIPFGLACFSSEKREPMLQPDFSSGASNLYVLSADEVEDFQRYLTSEV